MPAATASQRAAAKTRLGKCERREALLMRIGAVSLPSDTKRDREHELARGTGASRKRSCERALQEPAQLGRLHAGNNRIQRSAQITLQPKVIVA
jgi:hypothetical protein